MCLTFKMIRLGDGITLWGSLENARSRYTVSIDGGSPKIYTSSNGTLEASAVVLAHATNLGPGSHNITIFNTPLDGESRMEIDYATLYTWSTSSAEYAIQRLFSTSKLTDLAFPAGPRHPSA